MTDHINFTVYGVSFAQHKNSWGPEAGSGDSHPKPVEGHWGGKAHFNARVETSLCRNVQEEGFR